MEFENKYIDELIDIRKNARDNKDWKLSDDIRNYLDVKLIFIFDAKWGQEVWYLTNDYFSHKERKIETTAYSNRQYVEHKIKEDIRAENNFDAWLYSVRKSIEK